MGIHPPDDPGDDVDEAWRNGFEAACRLLQGQAATAAAQVDATQGDDEDGDEEDTECPSCGTETIRVLGGRRCPECGEEL